MAETIGNPYSAAPSSLPGGTSHPVEFKGQAGEYFGIWIVNVLLSIATLGIYSAWAKVRDKKYMYGNTFIDGHNFDYHATGPQILIGRLIVLGAYLLLVVSQLIHIGLYFALLLLLLCGIGWLIARAIRFNARMTSYRNVRFDFVGDGMGGWLRYVLYPVLIYLGMIVLGLSLLLVPFLTRSINKWTINNSRYGDRPFNFDADIGEYYKPYLLMIGIIVLALIAVVVLLGGSSLLGSFSDPAMANNPAILMPFILGIYAFLFLVILPASMIYTVAVRNLIFNNAVLDEKHSFHSTVEVLPFAWIIISNAVVSALTIGLMIPWARVRLARYMADHTEIIARGDLDGYSSSVVETHGVSAAEYADFEGFDIDLGI